MRSRFEEPDDPCGWVERVIRDAAAEPVRAGRATVTVVRAPADDEPGPAPPAYEVRLEPEDEDACPLACTFDALRPMYLSVGRQDVGEELWTSSLVELEQLLRSLVEAAVAGRYEERVEQRRFRAPRLEGAFSLAEGRTLRFHGSRGSSRTYRSY
ncbi:MAG: hypothetical protein JHC84_01495 [Solirubrobacteraceae bacterium]|nr:hypothetical protein [Solirubrobacteraceae bacterium]